MKLTDKSPSRIFRETVRPARPLAVTIKQNITVAIDGALLKRARAIAARRGLSVSALLAEDLRKLVADDAAYEAARRHADMWLKDGFPLGGAKVTDRGALHERRRVRRQ